MQARGVKRDFTRYAYFYILSFKGQSFLSFPFFGSFTLLVPRKAPYIYQELCKNCFCTYGHLYTMIKIAPAFLSKFAKTGEANEATVDIFAQQGLLHDAPGGLEVVWQHMARRFDLTAGSESRLQSIDAEPSCILQAVTLGFQLALMGLSLRTGLYMT